LYAKCVKLGPKNDCDILQFYVTIVENKETTSVLCELTLDHTHGPLYMSQRSEY